MPFSLNFHGDLPALLHRQWRNRRNFIQKNCRKTSIKDLIESFGLPHTEIGRLTVNEKSVDFSYQVSDGKTVNIYPVPMPWNVKRPSLLRPHPLEEIAFVVDVNVGKLARLLRMSGFNTSYDQQRDDAELASIAEIEKRILLSKDKGLLSRKKVEFGRYIRTSDPKNQLKEVIDLLDLRKEIRPFSRCMECNGILKPVMKRDIVNKLKPLTKKYYSIFSICASCGKIYWPGSHHEKMKQNFFDS